MSYEEFQGRIAKARKEPGFNLWKFATDGELGSAAEDLADEPAFIDGVTLRLRDSRIMVLIIGDGIQEGVEDLTAYLQLHAGIHANLALIDLSLWEMSDGGLLVIPRVPLKTTIIERGVVRLADSSGTIVIAPTLTSQTSKGPPRAKSGSEEEFFAEMQRRSPLRAKITRALMDALANTGVEFRFTPKTLIFEVQNLDYRRTILDVNFDGDFWGGSLIVGREDNENIIKIKLLLQELAKVNGLVVEYTRHNYHKFKLPNGQTCSVENFADHIPEIVEIVKRIASVPSPEA